MRDDYVFVLTGDKHQNKLGQHFDVEFGKKVTQVLENHLVITVPKKNKKKPSRKAN